MEMEFKIILTLGMLLAVAVAFALEGYRAARHERKECAFWREKYDDTDERRHKILMLLAKLKDSPEAYKEWSGN